MRITAGIIAGTFAILAASGGALAQQQSGVVASGAPEDIFLHFTAGADGHFTPTETEFRLALGGYYRFNMECPQEGPANEASISLAALDLWQNSHLRLISVTDTSETKGGPEINFHVQGLQIRAMECEGMVAAPRISFYPMKKGTYAFTVNDGTTQPSRQTLGSFIVE
jgi:hypothetical protein